MTRNTLAPRFLGLLGLSLLLLSGGLAYAGAPANDNVASATDLTGPMPPTGITTSGSNVGATREAGEPLILGNSGGASVWWKWDASATGSFVIETTGSSFDTLLAVHRATGPVPPFSNLILEAQDDDSGGTFRTSRVTISASIGVTYFITVDGYNGATGNISLAIRPPPPNDNFAGATVVSATLPAQELGINFLATKEANEPPHAGDAGGSSVWYSWTPAANVKVSVNTGGSNFNTLLAVYTWNGTNPPFGPPSNVTLVVQNDDAGGTLQSQVTFSATSGTTYFIAVDGKSNAQGNITLNLRVANSPANDDFSSAIALSGTLPITTTGSNVEATKESGEPSHGGNGGLGSVWWSWTSSITGRVTITTEGSSFDTLLSVSTEGGAVPPFSNLVLEAQNDNFSVPANFFYSQVSFDAVNGNVYKIAVDGSNTPTPNFPINGKNSGNIQLIISAAPANDDYTSAIVLADTLPTQIVTTGSNRFASQQVPDGEVGSGTSVWWSWTPTNSGQVTISTVGSTFDTILGVYTESAPVPPFANLTQIVQNDNFGFSNQSQVTFSAVAGTAYKIDVDGFNAQSGYIVLTIATPPSNDDYASPTVIPGALPMTPITQSTSFASKDLANGEPNHAGQLGGSSVWFSWTPVASETVTISTAGSNFDTVLAVYTEVGGVPPFANLIPVPQGANDQFGNSNQSQVTISVTAGTAYKIAVDGFGAASGNLTLTIANPPANDNLANAIPLSGTLPIQTSGPNQFASHETSEPNHAFVSFNPEGTSVWWSWTAPSGGKVTVNTVGSLFNTALGVYTGVSIADLKLVVQNDDFGGVATSQVTFFATAGTDYKIAVAGFFGASGTINLEIAATPINDDFANAATITGTSILDSNFVNINASKEGGEPNHAGIFGGASIWYTWDAPSSGKFTITTDGTAFDTLLAVYTGTSVANLTTIASNDDFNNREISTLTFNATAGVTYKIAVDGKSGASGSVTIALRTANAPANDDFASALPLSSTLPTNTTGNNGDATKEGAEPNHAGQTGGTSVWWSWTPTTSSFSPAAASGNVTVSTSGSDFTNLLAVYAGSSVAALSPVASTNQGQVTFAAVAGTTYRIAVDGALGAAGEIVLSLSSPPSNDNFANAIVLASALPVSDTTGSNVGATKEGVGIERNHDTGDFSGNAGGASVWWSWTPAASGTVTISTFGSDFDTMLGVYTGTTVGALTRIASNNDSLERTSKVDFSAVAGITYMIAVDGFNNNTGAKTGSITLAIRDFTLPELSILSIAHSPASPITGQPVKFTVTVQNTTAAEVGFNTVFFFQNSAAAPVPPVLFTAKDIITSLAGSLGATPSTIDLEFTLTAPAPGTYTAWGVADAFEEIVENDDSNNTGPTTPTAGHAWTVVPVPPDVNSANTAAGTVGSAFTYQITATNNPTGFAATGLPAGLSVDPANGAITGTPTTAGNFTVTASASNAGGTGASLAISVTIAAPPAPVINSPATATGTVGSSFSYTITATNSPNAFSTTTLPDGLTLNATTGLISGTPTAAGSFTVTVTATTALNASGSASVSVTIAAAPPVITSALSGTGVQGTAFNYAITATGTAPIVFSASNLPSGLSVSGSTISGTPTVFGTFVVTLSASNSAGTDSQALTLVIGNPLDEDNDGFSNELEAALGTNAQSASSTPFTANAQAGTPEAMGVTSFSMKLAFNASGSDSIGLSGFFTDPGGAIAGRTITVNIGGIIAKFTVNEKGQSPKGNESIKVSAKGGAINFSAKLLKGTYAAKLADEGLTGAEDVSKKIKTVKIQVLYADKIYEKSQFVEFSAKGGKGGSKGIGTEGKTTTIAGRR